MTPTRFSLPWLWLLLSGALALAIPDASLGEQHKIWAKAPPGQGDEISVRLGDEDLSARFVESSESRWEIVIYLDQMMSRSRSLHQAADIVIERVDELIALGDVTIVHADPRPSTTLPSSAERATLETVLFDVLFRTRGRERLHRLRSDHLTEDLDPEAIEEAWLGEKSLLEQQRNALITWLADQGTSDRPRLLLLSQDALGLESDFFYGQASVGSSAGAETARSAAAALLDTAAAYGWTVAPIVLPETAPSKRLDFARSVEVPVGVTVRFGSGDKNEKQPSLLPHDAIGLEPRPIESLGDLISKTGGALIESEQDLGNLIEDLSERRALMLSLPAEGLGEVETLELPGRDTSRIPVGPGRIGAAPTPIVGKVRLQAFLRHLGAEGSLPTECLVEFEQGEGREARSRLLVQSDLSGLSGEGPLRLRITAGIQLSDGSLELQGDSYSTTIIDRSAPWSWTGDIDLPARTEAVVVLVEEMGGAEFGTTFANFVRALPVIERGMAVDIEELKPKTRRVRIDALPAETRKRRIDVTAKIDESIVRLAFKLNGKQVAELTSPPWSTRLKLDRASRGQIVEAVGYDSEGREVDRDLVVINAPAESFWVRIIEPSSGEHVGPVTVEADVRIPDDARLDRVDFYWNDRLVATSREEPHRHTLLVPYSMPEGFIRVEAKLTDGNSTEDLVLMNSSQFREHVDVEIVELLVVVTNDEGEPVNGLADQQFRVLEDGVEQEIRDFSAAGDLPLTVGLAIDSSLSLFKRFPQVQKAARAFVQSLVPERDQAFLVGFGREPRLVQETTPELDRVAAGIDLLSPSGLTLVWEGIVLSLLELEPTQGRKALVVFYDGDDEDEKTSYRTALELAGQQGVPVYLVVMNNAAARTGGKSFSTRSFTKRLEDLARAGGGRVFYVSSSGDLTEVFERIGDELRSHYRLTYYPEAGSGEQRWRSIEVEMKTRGLEARTVSGYEPGLPQ